MCIEEKLGIARRRLLALLEDSGLPAPDEIQTHGSELRLLFHDHKVAVIVDVCDTEASS